MGRDYTRGRYGRNAFDDALALLALRALRERVPTAAIGFLRAARGAGGWNVLLRRSGGPVDDVSSTAIAILALRAAGVSRRDRGLRAGLSWMAVSAPARAASRWAATIATRRTRPRWRSRPSARWAGRIAAPPASCAGCSAATAHSNSRPTTRAAG